MDSHILTDGKLIAQQLANESEAFSRVENGDFAAKNEQLFAFAYDSIVPFLKTGRPDNIFEVTTSGNDSA